MLDLLFSAGQAFSVIGFAYGGYLSLSYCEQPGEVCARNSKVALLHHLTMA
jgi:hypothetical protein